MDLLVESVWNFDWSGDGRVCCVHRRRIGIAACDDASHIPPGIPFRSVSVHDAADRMVPGTKPDGLGRSVVLLDRLWAVIYHRW